jgi:hypothetical protein
MCVTTRFRQTKRIATPAILFFVAGNGFCFSTLFHLKSETMKRIVLLLVATFLTFSLVHAQKPEVVTKNKAGWHKIGDARVDFKTDKDKFIIIGKDRYKALQVKVKDAPVHMESMQVSYEGGGTEDVALNTEYKPGAESKTIELKNGSAEIKNVTFVYHTVANATNSKAEIELWGLK